MNRRRALGKGLGTILPEMPAAAQEENLRYLNAESIIPNRFQPRKQFGEQDLEALASSIRKEGVLLPIIVRQREGRYELIAGERRWRAAIKAGLKRIPAQVKEVGDREALELAMVENLQRRDLDPMEEARGYQEMGEKFSMTQEEIASSVGRSRPAIANALRLLKLPTDIQEQIRSGTLTRSHARTLLGLDDHSAMRQLAERLVTEAMSVRSTEQVVKRSGRPGARKPPLTIDPNVRAAQEKLQSRLGTKVLITANTRGAGKLELHFSSQDELSRLFDGLMTAKF
jgi:ParB family chromosome partitioning protein